MDVMLCDIQCWLSAPPASQLIFRIALIQRGADSQEAITTVTVLVTLIIVLLDEKIYLSKLLIWPYERLIMKMRISKKIR